MATVKLKFSASSSRGKAGTLYYQIIHRRVVRRIRTDGRLYPQEWDGEAGRIIIAPETEAVRRDYLIALQERVAAAAGRLLDSISILERRGAAYTADDIVEEYLSPSDTSCFMSFAMSLIPQLRQAGRSCTADRYTTAVRSFSRFRSGQDVLLENIDSELMAAYETWLRSSGICPNSISFYMRNLRAVYNRAVDRGLMPQRNPFRHVYTGIDKTVKRAVPLDVIRRIRNMDLSRFPVLDHARDMFMFSFYTRGMSFVDMAFLRKKDLSDGILSYRRHKTSQRLTIKWERPMQELVDKYDTGDSPYLLPLIRRFGADERRQYTSAAHRVNHALKQIGSMLGLTVPLTTYVARHGWASIAKSKNIPLSTISEAMGHDSESTTRIYLASLDTSEVDNANSLILNSL